MQMKNTWSIYKKSKIYHQVGKYLKINSKIWRKQQLLGRFNVLQQNKSIAALQKSTLINQKTLHLEEIRPIKIIKTALHFKLKLNNKSNTLLICNNQKVKCKIMTLLKKNICWTESKIKTAIKDSFGTE